MVLQISLSPEEAFRKQKYPASICCGQKLTTGNRLEDDYTNFAYMNYIVSSCHIMVGISNKVASRCIFLAHHLYNVGQIFWTILLLE